MRMSKTAVSIVSSKDDVLPEVLRSDHVRLLLTPSARTSIHTGSRGDAVSGVCAVVRHSGHFHFRAPR
jgi:hypothetical protein